MSNFDIRDTETKLIAQTGEPLTAKTTTSKLLGQYLNAPVIDLDIFSHKDVEADPERAEWFTHLPMLKSETGRLYIFRCHNSNCVPKEGLIRWLKDRAQRTEMITAEVLEDILKFPASTPQKILEQKFGKALTFCPEHLSKDFVIANHALLGATCYFKQAHLSIGNIAERNKQIEMFKKREESSNIVWNDSFFESFFGSYEPVIGNAVQNADKIIRAKFDSRDNDEVTKIGQDLTN